MFRIREIASRCRRAVRLYQRTAARCYRIGQLHPPFPVFIKGRSSALYAPDTEEARATYCEVIVQDDYRIEALARSETPRRIVDIGANIGAFSLLAAMLFPDSVIDAFEPHPEAYHWLTRNSQQRNIRPVNAAVSDVDGQVRFDLRSESTLSRIVDSAPHEVPAIAASSIAFGEEIDLAKLDCEGAEFRIFKDAAFLSRVKHLVCEFHLDAGGSLEELRKLLVDGSHEVIDIIPSAQAPKLYGLLWSRRR